MIVDLAILAVSIAFLVKFSDTVIVNAEKLAKISGIDQAAIGFIFIAISTSLPELTIGVISSLKGEGILSVGNLMGANIANLTLVFGAMALFGFKLGKTDSRQINYAVLSTSFVALIMIMAGSISMMFGLFCLSLFYIFSEGFMRQGIRIAKSGGYRSAQALKSAAYLVSSIFVVVISAHFVTNSIISLAGSLSVPESLLGATILSMGTTLPELSISVSAMRKGNMALAMGNVVGSVVTNLTFIIGIVAVMGHITLTGTETAIAAMLIGFNVLFLFMTHFIHFRAREGMALFICYGAFLFAMTMI